jgi:hypothetical protein
MVCIIRSKY